MRTKKTVKNQLLYRSHIWAIVSLVGLYIAFQLIADVGATRLVDIGGVVIPGGTFIFALSFTLRDMVHKRLGREWARAAVVVAVATNAILVLYFAAIAQIPTPVFYQYGSEWSAIFALVPSIMLASMAAEFISQMVNTEVYHWWWQRYPARPQWTRVLSSNCVSLPIDSLIFVTLAFAVLPLVFGGDTVPVGEALAGVIGGQALYKVAVAVASMPLIYLVSEKPLMDTV
jgi:queuosine precursor transporter